ncbi:MAG TPA: enoyl-CoA hydratase/isomerase family protein, partial [Acidimicrobiales bacterium]|nr:enoyl-CoA hydratase/isomerase family protein [Acidimicrobiales bacterium]
MSDVTVDQVGGGVAVVEIHRPPHNYFDHELIAELATTIEGLERDVSCRAVVLASEGKSFCAGADFSGASGSVDGGSLYQEALRLFALPLPI